MVIEGMLALTGQHFIIDFNEREGTLPGFVQGFNLVARDEHRHVAFGARFLRDMVAEDPERKKVIQRTLEEALPVTDKVLTPAVGRGRRGGLRVLRGEHQRDAGLCGAGADSAAEGHRARAGVRLAFGPPGKGSLGALRPSSSLTPSPAGLLGPLRPRTLEVVRALSVAGGMGRSYDGLASSGTEGL